jgi:hypothetical protein
MNQNRVITDSWSDPDTKTLYDRQWPDEPEISHQYEDGLQCGGCSFFAPFNPDWGLCCNKASRHFTETGFEHFTCPNFVNEGWGSHSFTDDPELFEGF